MSILICSSLRAAARRWRRVGPPGVASIGCRHQFADQPHRRESTATPVRASQILVKTDPVHDRGARRVDMDMDVDMDLGRLVRKRGKQEPTPATSPPATSPPTPATPTNTMIAAKSTETKKKMSATELKRLMKEYGPVAVSFHASVFLTTLGGFFSLVDYGLDVASLVKNFPVIANNLPHKSAGNLALAWALTTVTGPVRGLMTVTLTPHVAKLWWGRGAKRRLTELAKDKRNEESS